MPEKKFWKINPHLPVKDVYATVEWYKQNLGFGEEWFYGDPPSDGGCRRDELRMIFGKANGQFELAKDLSLIFFVTGVEAVYEEMQQRGLKIIQPLREYDYGIKEFTIEDLNGYRIRFAESI